MQRVRVSRVKPRLKVKRHEVKTDVKRVTTSTRWRSRAANQATTPGWVVVVCAFVGVRGKGGVVEAEVDPLPPCAVPLNPKKRHHHPPDHRTPPCTTHRRAPRACGFAQGAVLQAAVGDIDTVRRGLATIKHDAASQSQPDQS